MSRIRLDLLNNYKDISEKESKYYLIKGVLACLTIEEIIEFIDWNFTQRIILIDLIIQRIKEIIENTTFSVKNILFKKLLDSYQRLNNYHSKQRCSIFIISLVKFMDATNIKRMLTLFLNSKYINDRSRAYSFLLENWSPKFQSNIIKNWKKYKESGILPIFLKHFSTSDLSDYLNDILELLNEDINSEHYDLDTLILRNKFLAKFVQNVKDKIEELKNSDPISYIYIKKQLNEQISYDYAIRIYNEKPSSFRYLPVWYSEMKLYDVLNYLLATD